MAQRTATAALVLALALVAHADFPADLYIPAPKGTCVLLDSECGCATGECRCLSGVCLYTDQWTEHAHDRIGQIEQELAGGSCSTNQMSCVVEPEDMDSASKLCAIVGECSGTGDVVRADTATLVTPILQVLPNPASLPTAGQDGRLASVDGALGDCTVGGGSDRCLCQDDGLDWVTLACGPSSSAGLQEDALSMYQPIAGMTVLMGQVDENRTASTLVYAWARYFGTCSVPPQVGFATAKASPQAIDLTGGSPLAPVTGDTSATPTTFSTSDADRIIAPGFAYVVTVTNEPVCDVGASLGVWVSRT